MDRAGRELGPVRCGDRQVARTRAAGARRRVRIAHRGWAGCICPHRHAKRASCLKEQINTCVGGDRFGSRPHPAEVSRAARPFPYGSGWVQQQLRDNVVRHIGLVRC